MIVISEGDIEDEENWCSQINKLQQLLDKLECQVKGNRISREVFTECGAVVSTTTTKTTRLQLSAHISSVV